MNVLFKKKKILMIIFMAPVVILFSVIIVIPLLQSAVMSFTDWDGVNTAVFTGLDNYKKLFRSRDLTVSIRNSILYSVILTVYQVGFGTFFAYVITNFEFKTKNFFRNIYFFPVLLSVSVVAQLWISIYHGDFGLINQLAKAMGSDWSQNWLNEPIKGIVAIVLAEAWKGMGYHMLIIYAAMRNVAKVYYEAAYIDGASKGQSPNFLGIKKEFDEDAFRDYIRHTVELTKECHTEYIFRDIYKLHGNLDKLKRAVDIVRELTE